jgi:hypothetical protein
MNVSVLSSVVRIIQYEIPTQRKLIDPLNLRLIQNISEQR